ncbi:MAG TPA: outer membrane beta-barrel protein [Longimicrobiales bacterium]|nr:outer membrane beta-barrel protein [Longimicrobiales bacterium]
MNRIVRSSFAIVAAALAFSAAETQAQVGFSIAGGPSFATGDAGDMLDMGYHAKVAAAFSLPMLPIGLEADAMWTQFNYSDVDDASSRILSGTLNAVINLPTPGITPYIIGGVGFYNGKDDIPGLDTESETELGVNVGAGVRLGLVGLGGVFAEARLHNIFTEGESTRFIPVSLGIRF